jgi:hypothetical protein
MTGRNRKRKQLQSRFRSRTKRSRAHRSNKKKWTSQSKSKSSKTRPASNVSRWAHGTNKHHNCPPHLSNNRNKTFQAWGQTSSFHWRTWAIHWETNRLRSCIFRLRDSTWGYSFWRFFVWWTFCVCMGWFITGAGVRIMEREGIEMRGDEMSDLWFTLLLAFLMIRSNEIIHY